MSSMLLFYVFSTPKYSLYDLAYCTFEFFALSTHFYSSTLVYLLEANCRHTGLQSMVNHTSIIGKLEDKLKYF